MVAQAPPPHLPLGRTSAQGQGEHSGGEGHQVHTMVI